METLKKLKSAAKNEKWEYVDSMIPQISGNLEYAKWAYDEGIKDPDGNIRDLAVSIIEKSEIPENEFTRMRDTLCLLMENDKNKYVQFRSAFALVNHGPGKHKKKVLSKLYEAEKDKDVAELAKEYLKKCR